jgi:hypothetical protein
LFLCFARCFEGVTANVAIFVVVVVVVVVVVEVLRCVPDSFHYTVPTQKHLFPICVGDGIVLVKGKKRSMVDGTH